MNKNDQFDRTSSLGLLSYGIEFYDSFKLINDQEPKITKLTPVKYFLLSHAIELALKAILRKNGKTIDEIKNFGHDIDQLAIEVSWSNNLLLNDNEKAILKVTNDYYKKKEFEYINVGPKTLPEILDLSTLTGKITKFAQQIIY